MPNRRSSPAADAPRAKGLLVSQIRKSHTVEIIDRRLRDYAVGGVGDPMELVGLHDELSRVERKWLATAAERKDGTARRNARPLADAATMNARFDRLRHLIDAALRQKSTDPAVHRFLEAAATSLQTRKPLPEA